MKKLAILVLLVAVSCRRQVEVGSPPNPNEPGAATPREAVQLFMSAAKVQDLQAFARVWGTTAGPVTATLKKSEIEQRELILFCYLKHDSYQVLGEAPAPAGERVLALENRYQDLTRSTNFWVTRGPANRWYVRTFDNEALRDICGKR